MRALLALWLSPVLGFWTWHLLASRGIYFSQEFHTEVFRLYADTLGMEPDAITALLAKALVTDGLILLAIFAFRRRRAILGFMRPRLARAWTSGRALLAG
ncbi:DUF6105 family protein [Aureimonas psammosilenae]|uniref:DUF6105 family protein n=1 Tax=Aureimonas psammosilenae TaxID=2495496 RepID=UPI0012609CAB|nr:DUF6105 family protein [Aureimonas psammosilenae]